MDFELALKSKAKQQEHRDKNASVFELYVWFLKTMAETKNIEELKYFLKYKAR
jgi:hypothetical protein